MESIRLQKELSLPNELGVGISMSTQVGYKEFVNGVEYYQEDEPPFPKRDFNWILNANYFLSERWSLNLNFSISMFEIKEDKHNSVISLRGVYFFRT